MSSGHYGAIAGEQANSRMRPDGAATEYTVEYAYRTAGDDCHVWNTEPWAEEIYPLADRIKAGRRDHGKVYRRRVIVVDDWEEVTGPMSADYGIATAGAPAEGVTQTDAIPPPSHFT